jgi:hypothetical protein
VLCDNRENAINFVRVDRHRFERHGEQPVTIRHRETDARTSGVDTEPDTTFH